MTTTNQTDLEILLQWAEGQRDKQIERDSNFIIVNNCYKSIWGQVISKIQSMMMVGENICPKCKSKWAKLELTCHLCGYIKK